MITMVCEGGPHFVGKPNEPVEHFVTIAKAGRIGHGGAKDGAVLYTCALCGRTSDADGKLYAVARGAPGRRPGSVRRAGRRNAVTAYMPFAATAAARKLIDAHALGAEADAGFDAGEFSGPAHDAMLHDEMEALADRCGVGIADLWAAADPGDLDDIFEPDPCLSCGHVHGGHHCGDGS